MVFDPREPGVQTKISAPVPLRPFTEKLPVVVRKICPVTGSNDAPLISSEDELSPTSDPSKYSVHVPLVLEPSELGANAIRSSSLPETPVTLNDPIVLMSSRPSGASPITSTSSELVLNPTSEPSKYHSKVPAVLTPNETDTKRMTSESSTLPTFEIVDDLTRLNKMLPSDIKRKASTSLPFETPRPTSDPSKYNDQVPVAESNFKISSSSNATSPTVPLVVELR